MAPSGSDTSSPSETRVTLDTLRADFELYAYNFLTIITKDGDRIPFVMNRAQRKVFDAMMRQYLRGAPMRVVILKSRQTGISTLIQAVLFWLAHLRENFKALTLAHKAESVLHLFGMSRDHYHQLEMRNEDLPEALCVKKKHHTRREIHFEGTNSRIQVEVVGEVRGYTAQGLHLSEAAFYKDPEKTFRAVKQAVPRRPNTLVAVESTPNGMNAFQKMYVRAKRGKSSYAAVFIAWFDDEDSLRVRATFGEEDLDDDERELRKLYGVSLDQLAWRRHVIEDECDGDKEAFLQEYPSDDVTCFLASGRPAFDREGLQVQIDNMLVGEEVEQKIEMGDLLFDPQQGKHEFVPMRKGRLRVQRRPQRLRSTIVSADPSEGDLKSDFSPIVALDRIALDVSALWHGRLPPDLLADKAIDICEWYGQHGDEPILVWEANNHGAAFGIRVQERGYPFIYYRTVSEDTVAGKVSEKPGYFSSVRGKANYVHTLRAYVRKQIAPVRDPLIVGEMMIYVLNDKDTAEAQEGEDNFDDIMTALGIGLMVHRGSMENPLEPMRQDELKQAHAAARWKLEVGVPLDPSDVKGMSVTCKDLEEFDERQYRLERAKRKRGSGGML